MKRIRVWADLDSTGLFEEIGRCLRHEETTISLETWKSLQQWVKEYNSIIRLSQAERFKAADKIKGLDEEGLELLREIRSQWQRDVKTGEEIQFLYYSEGLFRFLSIDGEIVIQ